MQTVIKNVICFCTNKNNISTLEEVQKKKKDDYNYNDFLILACDKFKYNLVFLDKEFVSFTITNEIINVNDYNNGVYISLTKENIKDTVIFQGQNNDNLTSEFIALMQSLEAYGFLMFNTINEIINASDKYLSATLFAANNVPQPNYILVSKKSLLDDNGKTIKDSFYKQLDTIYDNNQAIDDTSERKYVVKTLDGSLGIGVFICNDKEIISILQTIFVLDPEIELIIQEFKQNTGDIRCHLFSIDGKNYEILACMKRNTIDGDFRSNVSLGATTDSYELSKEQEDIIKRAAKVSKCKWVGIDLMSCADGSEVIIEYNSSPGVNGICAQIKKNIFEIILDKIETHLGKHPITEGAEGKLAVQAEKGEYDFEKVILVSNSNDKKSNDALLYLTDFCKVNNIELHNFVAETFAVQKNKDSFTLKDKSSSINIKDDEINKCIVITRSSVISYEDSIDGINTLDKAGFIVLNPTEPCKIAADKYQMCKLFKDNSIPTPDFVLIKKEDVLDGEEKVEKLLKEIYNDFSFEKNADKFKFVVKLLDGHGGTGVSLLTGDLILGNLQTMFALKSDIELLIQKFEESDGGDIRVHVLTHKGNQQIIGAMKRKKLSNDFRSNVSLGATVELTTLTPEQERIALNVAKASKMPWCAVDIMPLKDGRNVVLEFNDSAGVDGISQALGKNVFNLILSTFSNKSIQENIHENNKPSIVKGAEVIYDWFVKNFDKFYDEEHGINQDNIKYCDLIDGNVKADCSGYVGAVLKFCGYDADGMNFNVKHGSFNLKKNLNDNVKNQKQEILDNIKYMKDLEGNWHAYKFDDITDWSECIPGDILYSSSHVAIAKTKGATELYHWSQHELNNDGFEMNYKAYWRLEK